VCRRRSCRQRNKDQKADDREEGEGEDHDDALIIALGMEAPPPHHHRSATFNVPTVAAWVVAVNVSVSSDPREGQLCDPEGATVTGLAADPRVGGVTAAGANVVVPETLHCAWTAAR
jgi:hypothetical protein